jgi:hypothetical protein
MSHGLPPDLAKLGDELTTAAQRSLAERRHRAELRRRLAVTGIVGALIFAALVPAALRSGHQAAPELTSVARSCDPPRSDKFPHTGCGEPMVLHRPYAIQ